MDGRLNDCEDGNIRRVHGTGAPYISETCNHVCVI